MAVVIGFTLRSVQRVTKNVITAAGHAIPKVVKWIESVANVESNFR
jgi:Na+/serine symporter